MNNPISQFSFSYNSNNKYILRISKRKKLYKILLFFVLGIAGIGIPIYFIMKWNQITPYLPVSILFGLILFFISLALILSLIFDKIEIQDFKIEFNDEFISFKIDSYISNFSYNDLRYKDVLVKIKETPRFLILKTYRYNDDNDRVESILLPKNITNNQTRELKKFLDSKMNRKSKFYLIASSKGNITYASDGRKFRDVKNRDLGVILALGITIFSYGVALLFIAIILLQEYSALATIIFTIICGIGLILAAILYKKKH